MRTTYEITDCAVCGTPDAEMIAEAEQIREETEQLWAFHTRRVRGDAPPRHLADRAFFSQAPPLAVTRCPCCGLVFRNPRERDRDLTALYAEEAVDDAVLQSLCTAQRPFYRSRARRLRRYLHGRGDGLEVGSYVGAFLVAAREQGWCFEGVHVNAATNRFARALGFRVTDGTIGDVPAEPRFRAIAFWNCFDQLADPRAAARSAYERLRPGGTLAVRVPNGGFYALLRARLTGRFSAPVRAILAHNNLLGFPYRHGFTPPSLARLLEETGFAVTAMHGSALVLTADRWTRRWAALEERALKIVLRLVRGADASPWFEIYARRQ